MIFQEFKDWSDKILPEVEEVSKLLQTPMSDEPELLIRDLTKAEVWLGRFHALLAQANAYLDRYSFEAMPPKGERTEKDREVLLDSETSPIRLVRDTIEGYTESIKTRLSMGQSLLRYHTMMKELVVYKKKPEMDRPF